MKIGIVTLYRELNCGAYLQAYAMKKKLEQLGHTAVFIENKDPRYYLNAIKGGVLKNPGMLHKNIKRLNNYLKAHNEFQVVDRSTPLDAIVIGSDELWNVANTGFVQKEYYWGRGLNAKEIISYAVSCNYSTVEQMSDYEKLLGGNLLGAINQISVRDRHTKEVIQHFTQNAISVVLDPTFLIKKYPMRKNFNKQKYILIYAYEGSISAEMQGKIKRFAKEKGLKLISYNFYNSWCDESIFDSPLDFPTYVKNAAYIITTTFHGSVFSIIYNRKFMTISQNNIKIDSLLTLFGVEERQTTDISILEKEIAYDVVNKIIEDQREVSMKFLNNIGLT